MTEPRRPWWKRKRWLAAGLLWLAVMYPLSYGPVVYVAVLGWIPGPVDPAVQACYAPLGSGFDYAPRFLQDALSRYVQWWLDRGAAASD